MDAVRGVVVAGSRHTASAGAEALREGGNAVDAAVAACFATGAGEPSLTSLAGSGIMLVAEAGSSAVHICDFNANGPGLGGDKPAVPDFFPVELAFGPALQVFHIGRAAAAVPGALPGLWTALGRWGRLAPAQVVRPACRLLRDGVTLDEFQVECFRLLEPILLHSEGVRKIYAPRGHLLKPGERFANPALADALDQMAAGSWETYHRDKFVPAVLDSCGPGAGGHIAGADMDAYRVEVREPLRLSYRDHEIFMPPRPTLGGQLIGTALAEMEKFEPGRNGWNSARHLHNLASTMRNLEAAHAGVGTTTHVSAIDADGGAAAVTLSHGEGNGYLVGDTGIIMNNMMGEADIHPGGFHAWPPGERLSSMMAPTLIRSPDGTFTVLGTGGSSRIRTAILQVIVNLVDFSFAPEQAVGAGRIHLEHGVLNAETFDLPGGTSSLEPLLGTGERTVLFDRPHLFFGGVHTAQRRPEGELLGGGDPRRSGVCAFA